MRVSSDMPDDVLVLHDALQQLQTFKQGEASNILKQAPLVLNLKNCGTALRFLQVHLEHCYPGAPITLTGDARLMERRGKPTTQTTSALILHGVDVPVTPDESPYITMTRKLMKSFSEQRERSFGETVFRRSGLSGVAGLLEADWSAAAFWYEYIAIHGGELLLEGLTPDSIQGDRIVADLYAEHFGVRTEFVPEGARIHQTSNIKHQTSVSLNFERIPDLYPAIALTCERLGIALNATGTERLRYKESDRLEAVRLHEVRNDHRMAMALLAADFPVSEEEQACIGKSYPLFIEHLSKPRYDRDINATTPRPARDQRERRRTVSIEHITPVRGVNDDNLGKKHALSKLIHAATSEYVWLHDDDVELPKAAKEPNLTFPNGKENLDLVILPLRMESSLLSERTGVGSSLLERLQRAEYAAIQELSMRTAMRGKAVMCSGANLIVRRDVWLACESELHPEIPSGDDMFLLEAVKRHGYKVGVIDDPDYTAVVRPQTSWRTFFCQRMRWAGKAPHYTDKDILRCGAFVLLANLLQILCPLIILIKFPVEWILIKKREPQTSWLVALLLEIIYPLYLFVCLIGGLFRKSW